MNINRFSTKVEAAAAAGEALNNLLMNYATQPVLLLLSGGSAFLMLDYVSPSSLTENLTVTMLDERFSQDPQINNFLQLQKLDFYTKAQAGNVDFIDTLPRPNENIYNMRARLEIVLKKWRGNHPRGKIIATLGMGADGHIAGIFPYAKDAKFFEATFENQNFFAAYRASGKHQYEDRLTAAFPLLKNIDEAIMFISGANKKPKLHELLTGQSQPHTLPAVGLYETRHFQIFTDIT